MNVVRECVFEWYSYVFIIHKDRVVSQLSVVCWSDCVYRYDSPFLHKLWTVAVRISVRTGTYPFAVCFSITEESDLKKRQEMFIGKINTCVTWMKTVLLYLLVVRHFSYDDQRAFKKIKLKEFVWILGERWKQELILPVLVSDRITKKKKDTWLLKQFLAKEDAAEFCDTVPLHVSSINTLMYSQW